MTYDSLVKTVKTSVKHFAEDETGATAIEYGLIAGLIAVAIIAGVAAIGTNLQGLFDSIGTKLGMRAT